MPLLQDQTILREFTALQRHLTGKILLDQVLQTIPFTQWSHQQTQGISLSFFVVEISDTYENWNKKSSFFGDTVLSGKKIPQKLFLYIVKMDKII